MFANILHEFLSLLDHLHEVELQRLRPMLQLLGLGLVIAIVLMQALVEVALQFPHGFIEHLPSHVGLLGLDEDLGEPADLLPHFGCGELHRLDSEAQSSLHLPNGPEDLLYHLLLLRGDLHQPCQFSEVLGSGLQHTVGLMEAVEVWFLGVGVLAGEDAVEVPPGEDCCVGKHLVVAFDVGEMHLLLQQELVELGVTTAVCVTDQVVQVFPNERHAEFGCLLGAEGVVHVQDGDYVSAVFFVHILHQMFELQELSDGDLDALASPLQVVVNQEELLAL